MARIVPLGVAIAATFIALVSALPHAGSWNDGSRLATVEALVDDHTLAIDRSIFIQPSRPRHRNEPTPYPPGNSLLMEKGSQDKLFIEGHYYSDKPHLLQVYLAGVYQVWQWCGGFPAKIRPDWFCYLMTLASSGVGYVAAVYCTYRLAEAVGLAMGMRLALTIALSLGTFALPYVRHVNGHLVLLGLAMAMMVSLVRLANESGTRPIFISRIVWLGTLAGWAYALDLGVGPVLVLCLLPLIWFRTRRLWVVGLFGLAAFPWFLTHHVFNYAIGGTFQPANNNPEYFSWPGSPFHAKNMTGGWNHTPGHFVVYALAILGGKRGFFGHNLPLFLVLPGMVLLWRHRPKEWPELLFAFAWFVGTWLMYAALSNNYSGQCCSIRWFVPLLAPGFYVLAILLREDPILHLDFFILSAWGLVLGAIMWWHGPWIPNMVPMFWPIQGAALASWILSRRWYLISSRFSGEPKATAPLPLPAEHEVVLPTRPATS